MTTETSLDTEISRILASDTTRELASQLKTFNSRENRIEQEIMLKSAQINKLQNYLKDQISNIHAIVEENRRLKNQIEGLRKDLEVKNEQCGRMQKDVETLTQMSKASNYINQRLEERNQELENQVMAFQKDKQIETRQMAMQTQGNNLDKKIEQKKPSMQVGVNTQKEVQLIDTSRSPKTQKSNSNNLLAQISELKQTVTQLRFQKNELQLKLQCLEPAQSHSVTNTQYDEQSLQKKRSTVQIIDLICQGQLGEVKFKGEIMSGLKYGKGVCEYEGDIHFEGVFHNDKRHGLGSLYAYGQVLYRGYWHEGLMEGKGVLTMLEGEIQSYEGQFHHGRLQGYGYMKLKSGKKIMAFWQDGKIVGKCMETDRASKRFIKPELIQCY